MIHHLTEMENRIMSAIEDAVAELTTAVNNANSRFQNTAELETALAAEREKYDALVTAEAAEDEEQNQALADARAATDAALAEVQELPGVLSGLADQVNILGTVTTDPTNATDAPVDTAPVEDPAPVDVPAETAPVEEAPVSTPDAPVDAAPVEEPTPTDAPVDTPVATDAPADAAPVAATGATTGTDDPQSTANMNPAL